MSFEPLTAWSKPIRDKWQLSYMLTTQLDHGITLSGSTPYYKPDLDPKRPSMLHPQTHSDTDGRKMEIGNISQKKQYSFLCPRKKQPTKLSSLPLSWLGNSCDIGCGQPGKSTVLCSTGSELVNSRWKKGKNVLWGICEARSFMWKEGWFKWPLADVTAVLSYSCEQIKTQRHPSIHEKRC